MTGRTKLSVAVHLRLKIGNFIFWHIELKYTELLFKAEEAKLSGEEVELQSRVEKLSSILSGEKPIYLHLQFLIRNDKTDPLILKNTKVGNK